MRVAIKLLLGPYTFQHSEVAIKIAERALEKGVDVILFLYMDGIHCVKRGQSPREFMNVEEKIKELSRKGVNVVACLRCASARGYALNDVTNGVALKSLYDFAEEVKNADVVMVIG